MASSERHGEGRGAVARRQTNGHWIAEIVGALRVPMILSEWRPCEKYRQQALIFSGNVLSTR